MNCSVDGCGRPAYARTWCTTHYVRWQKYGDVTVDMRRLNRRGEAARFWDLVEKTDTCWTWIGSRNVSGYGKFWTDDGRTVRPHRWAYEQEVGPIPVGLQLDHLCKNRACVRPDHLEPVTGKVNTERGSRATATHCKHGHEFTPENTYIVKPTRTLPHGGRGCVICRKANSDRYLARKKAEREANPPPPKPFRKMCKNGHALTPENTYVPPGKTIRTCRTCRKEAWERQAAKRKAA
jgi:hypothetical protein